MATITQLHSGASGGVGVSYTTESVAEGVMEVIYQLTPEDTFYTQRIRAQGGEVEAMNVKHEWQIRTRGARQGTAGTHRAVPAGDPFMLDLNDFEDLALPTRKFNYCEIFRVLPRVTESMAAAKMYGVEDIVADQINFRLVDLGIYFEYQLVNGSIDAGPTSPTSTVGRQMDGLKTIIGTTNVGSNPLVEADLNTLLVDLYVAGGRPQDLICGPTVRNLVNTFTGGGNTRFLDAVDKKTITTISMWEGATAIMNLHLSRDLNDGDGTADLQMIDFSTLRLAWYRPAFLQRLPIMGGDIRFRAEFEVTFEYGDPAGQGELTAVGY